MGWTAPYGIECARMRLLQSQTREPSVNQIIRIGMDTSKHIFQLHGVDAVERPVLRRKLRRSEVLAFFAKLPPTVIGMEACGAAHYWARELRKLGHEVKLMAPQHVKAYVKRNKNDGRDAEGLCEAMSRPTMQFVPVKTEEQQAALMLAGVRQQLIARRTQLSNTIRGYAAEFGLTAAKGLDKIEPLLARIAQDETVPALARELFAVQGQDYAQLQIELKAIEVKLMAWHRANACSRRLAQIPGVGPIGATALVMKTPDPRAFPSGRHFAAWLGLTPKDHSTAGKTRLGKITRAGDEVLRSLLVAGATAVIQQVRNGRGRPSAWLLALLKRKPPKLAAVALANKIARIMEADDDGRKLRWRADAWRTGIRRLRDQPVGGFAAPVEPGAARGQQMVGSIDPRCETLRGTHWPVKVAGVFGTRVAENHLGQRSATASTGRTYGCKRSDQTVKKTLVARGPSTYGSRRSPGRRDCEEQTRSKRGVAAVDHKTIGGVIGRRVAHQVHGDSAEIRRLAEPPHRNPRQHGANKFFIGQHFGGHVALDPAGQDGVGGDAVTRQLDRERADQRVDGGLGGGIVLGARGAENRGEARGRDQPAEGIA